MPGLELQKMSEASWGCMHCWGGDARSAFTRIRSFPVRSMLVDDSHLIIGVRVCPDCRQAFVTVFTETIDWAGGDDPQHWSFMPVAESELTEVATLDESAVHGALVRLGRGRETLERDLPKGGDEKISRATGLQFRPHD